MANKTSAIRCLEEDLKYRRDVLMKAYSSYLKDPDISVDEKWEVWSSFNYHGDFRPIRSSLTCLSRFTSGIHLGRNYFIERLLELLAGRVGPVPRMAVKSVLSIIERYMVGTVLELDTGNTTIIQDTDVTAIKEEIMLRKIEGFNIQT